MSGFKYTKVKPLIGIRFTDNDYRKPIRHFLEIFIESQIEITKEVVVEIFHKTILGYCIVNGMEAGDNTKEWLTITMDNVYLNEECLKFLEEHELAYNGEFHYIDLNQNRIFTI